jgi:hypothetical protein
MFRDTKIALSCRGMDTLEGAETQATQDYFLKHSILSAGWGFGQKPNCKEVSTRTGSVNAPTSLITLTIDNTM